MSRARVFVTAAAILALMLLTSHDAAAHNEIELHRQVPISWLEYYKNQIEPFASYEDNTKQIHQVNDEAEDENLSRYNEMKRSAVATALNAGRRRRQPAPSLGKVLSPNFATSKSYLRAPTLFAPTSIGVLNDVGTFFDTLRDNLETLAHLSPQERASLLQPPPTVMLASASGGGGGSSFRKLHALRPLRPSSNIRTYNRRSYNEKDGVYPGANNHNPSFLWTGLGR